MEVVYVLLVTTAPKAQGSQSLVQLAPILAVTGIQTLLTVQHAIQECTAKAQP